MPNFNIIAEVNAVKKSLNTLETTRKLDKDNTYAPYFAKINDALTSLSKLEKGYFEVNELGEYKKADLKTVENIYKAYEELKNAIKEVGNPQKREKIRNTFTEKDFADAYFDTIDYVGKLVDKDIKALNLIITSTNDDVELPKAYESARNRKLVVTEPTTKESGQLSERIPVQFTDENGREHTGYFTKEKRIDYAKMINEKVGSMLKTFWPKNNKAADAVFENVMKVINSDKVMKKPKTLNCVICNLPEILTNYEETKKHKITSGIFENEEQFNRFCPKDDNFKQAAEKAVEDLLNNDKEVGNVLIDDSINGYYIKRSYGSSITQRNSAMSSVAKLLGVEKVICHSENMVANIDGVDYNGVFMENAQGGDISKATMDGGNPFYKCFKENGYKSRYGEEQFRKANLFDDEKLIRDIANIQVLDYVCNNIDRHNRNYSYIFSEDGSKVIGIQGFDNDFSFGTTVNEERTKDCIAPSALFISDLQIITKSMADTLGTLKKESLDFVLKGYNLSKAEKDAAFKRVELVNKAIEEGKIRVVDDEALKNLTINKLAEEKLEKDGQIKDGRVSIEKGYTRNLFVQFYRFKNAVKCIFDENELKFSQKTKFAKANKVNENKTLDAFDSKKLANDRKFLENINKKMVATDKKVWFGTEEYAKLEKAVMNVAAMTERISQNMKKSYTGINAAYIIDYKKSLKQLKEQALAYKIRKSEKAQNGSFNMHEKNRYDAVVELADFATNRITGIDKALETRKEKVSHGNRLSYDEAQRELNKIQTDMITKHSAGAVAGARYTAYKEAVELGRERFEQAYITKEDLGEAVKKKVAPEIKMEEGPVIC